VSLGGLWGVLWTDLLQFALKMSIVIAIAVYAVKAAGGMSRLLARLAEAQAGAGGHAATPLAFFPDFSRGFTAEPLWMIPIAAFLVNVGLQWWAFWYPGAEPGGGGYIAQRIFSARDEKQGLLAVLWFNIAHYAVRPWPWIMTALAVIVLYPGLKQPETGYMLVMNHYLPASLRGLAIAGFLAAFMSTVATQLNWGASYLVADFYRRFIQKGRSERHYVVVSRLSTVLLVVVSAWVSVNLSSIGSGWQVVLEVGAGTGAVYLLRWYWWRINAWSEISAMASSLVVSLTLNFWKPFSGNSSVVFAKTAIVTTAVTTLIWLAITFLTKPESEQVLVDFYRKVRPDVRGWGPVAKLVPRELPTRDLGANLRAWLLGCAMVYLCLFGTGNLILQRTLTGAMLLGASAICAALLYRHIAHWRA
jgi:Na+/proline symporter